MSDLTVNMLQLPSRSSVVLASYDLIEAVFFARKNRNGTLQDKIPWIMGVGNNGVLNVVFRPMKSVRR